MASDVTVLSLLTASLTASLGIRLFVAGVLLFAGLHKLSSRLEFEGIVGQYKLTPRSLNPFLSLGIPLLELLLAGAVLFTPKVGAVLSAGLLAGYALAILINISRGRAHIDCGCGGESTPLSPALVWRNLLMVVLLGGVLFAESTRTVDLSGVQTLLAVMFALGLGALYVSYNQLQVNAGIYRRLWLGERVG